MEQVKQLTFLSGVLPNLMTMTMLEKIIYPFMLDVPMVILLNKFRMVQNMLSIRKRKYV